MTKRELILEKKLETVKTNLLREIYGSGPGMKLHADKKIIDDVIEDIEIALSNDNHKITSRSEDMRHLLDQIQQVSINENEFDMPDKRSLEDQLEQLAFIADDYQMRDAAKWLRTQLGK